MVCEIHGTWLYLILTSPYIQFPDLASFLVARACRSTELASYFYWYLSVECTHKDNAASIKFEKIRYKFLEDLRNVRHVTCCSVCNKNYGMGSVCVWREW